MLYLETSRLSVCPSTGRLPSKARDGMKVWSWEPRWISDRPKSSSKGRVDTTLKLTNQDPGEAGRIFGFNKECEPGRVNRESVCAQ